MKFKNSIWMFFCIPLLAQPTIERVPSSASKHSIRGYSAAGVVLLDTVHTHLEVRKEDGKVEQGDLTVIRDNTSGYYIWLYARRNQRGTGSFLLELQSGRNVVWLDPDGIVDFQFAATLYVMKQTRKADSLDAAERASIDELQRDFLTFEKDGFKRNSKALQVKGLDRDFACPPMNPKCNDGESKITNISRLGDSWRFLLRNRYEVELIYDADLNWVSTRNLTSSPNLKELQIRSIDPQ